MFNAKIFMYLKNWKINVKSLFNVSIIVSMQDTEGSIFDIALLVFPLIHACLKMKK